MNLPTGARGRLVALGILLIIVILLAHYLAFPAARHYAGIKQQIGAKQEEIQRYRGVLSALPALREAADELELSAPLRPFLLDGSNRALAAADLQKRLQNIASERGARIVSLRVRDAETDGPFERIPVDVHLQVGLAPLHDVLHAIETSRPALFTQAFSIQSRTSRRNRRGTGATGSQHLDARITLYGLRAAGSPGDEG